MSDLEISEKTRAGEVEFLREITKGRENTFAVEIFKFGEAKSLPQGKGIV